MRQAGPSARPEPHGPTETPALQDRFRCHVLPQCPTSMPSRPSGLRPGGATIRAVNPPQASSTVAPTLLAERMPPGHLFLRLDGRIGRAMWWRYGVLMPLLASVTALALLDIARVAPQTASTLVNLLLFWPAVAISVKRWHDLGRSGWWVLIFLVPVILVPVILVQAVCFILTFVANGIVRGDAGPNRFGPESDAPGWPGGEPPPGVVPAEPARGGPVPEGPVSTDR